MRRRPEYEEGNGEVIVIMAISLFRCAACGSSKVIVDTQNDGVKYDYVKGAIGTAVLGAGGAAAGITNNSQRVYKCQACGITLTYPMSEELKAAIDIGTESLEARSNIKLAGVPIHWSYLVSKYPNIESGYGDYVEKEKERKKELEKLRGIEILREKGDATQEEFDNAIDYIKKFYSKIGWTSKNPEYSIQNPMKLPEYLALCNASDIFVENYYKFRLDQQKNSDGKFQEYRGLDYYDLQKNFYFYVVRRYVEEKGECPFFVSTSIFSSHNNPQFGKFIENNEFIKEMVKQLLVPEESASTIKAVNSRKMDYASFMEIVFGPGMGKKIRFGPFVAFASSKIESGGYIIIPLWKEEKGSLYHLDSAYNKYQGLINISKQDYFIRHPEEKNKYDEAISKNNQLLNEAKQIDRSIQAKKAEIDKLKQAISSNLSSISDLQKKLFGRKKARAEILVLEDQNKDYYSQISSLEDEIKSLSVSRPVYEEIKDIEKRFEEANDYYTVWINTPQ